jgi:hypothetical protein
MVDPTIFLVWTGLGILVGWLTGQLLFGYRLIDDLVGGVFGSVLGGSVAYVLFGDLLGGALGSILFGGVLAATLIVIIRVLPRHNLT